MRCTSKWGHCWEYTGAQLWPMPEPIFVQRCHWCGATAYVVKRSSRLGPVPIPARFFHTLPHSAVSGEDA